jgi:hypothetical protein
MEVEPKLASETAGPLYSSSDCEPWLQKCVNPMRPILKRIFVIALVVLAVLYIYDDLSVRHRMKGQKQGDPFDAVMRMRVLAIPQKGNRIEYALDAQTPIESDPCVHSLFPHFGYTPCWYLKREAKNPIPMVILFPVLRGAGPTFRFRADGKHPY